MKVHILQENLIKGVNALSRLAIGGGKMPILSHILFQAKPEGLWLSATDLELSVTIMLGAKVEEEGAIAVPARIFAEFLGSLTVGKMTLTTLEDQLRVQSGIHSAKIQGMGAKEFPEIPVGMEKKLFVFNGDFEEVVQSVALAAANDESRPMLTGVLWREVDEGLQMIATDGYRLSLRVVKVEREKVSKKEGKEVKKKSWIIPARSLLEVAQLIKGFKLDEEVNVGLTADERQLVFKVGEFVAVSRLLTDEFPDVEQIIPQKSETTVIVEQGEFLTAVRMAAIFARESANIVKLVVKEGKLTLYANSPQVGENESQLLATINGSETTMAFNSRYLLDLLSGVKGSKKAVKEEHTESGREASMGMVTISMNGSLAPGLFTIDGVEGFLHVIMPVRTQTV